MYKPTLPNSTTTTLTLAPPQYPYPLTLATYTSTSPSTQNPHDLSSDTVLLLIHGNSSSSQIWTKLFSNPPRVRLLAIDLPGHGASSNIPPSHTQDYTQLSYARAILSALTQLHVSKLVIAGWSLGGHVGIELLELLRTTPTSIRPLGMVITGTPPVPQRAVGAGFHGDVHMSAAARAEITAEEVAAFARGGAGTAGPGGTQGAFFEEWQEQAVARTDGKAREVMFRTFGDGSGASDQRYLVERGWEGVRVGVLDGEGDPFVKGEFVRGLGVANGWTDVGTIEGVSVVGSRVEVRGVGHALMWERPEVYLALLERFLEDCVMG